MPLLCWSISLLCITYFEMKQLCAYCIWRNLFFAHLAIQFKSKCLSLILFCLQTFPESYFGAKISVLFWSFDCFYCLDPEWNSCLHALFFSLRKESSYACIMLQGNSSLHVLFWNKTYFPLLHVKKSLQILLASTFRQNLFSVHLILESDFFRILF